MNEHTVLLLKVIIFILVIVGYVGYSIYKNRTQDKKSLLFPPWPSKCPDQWEVIDNNKCKNVKKLGNCHNTDSDLVFSFDDYDIFKGKQSLYYKCKWANNCNTSWEGIDNLCI